MRLDTRTDAAERALLATLQAVPVDVAPSPFQYLLGCATARASRLRTRLGACLRAFAYTPVGGASSLVAGAIAAPRMRGAV